MADNFGLKIGLEGEKEFKKALADINQSFKVLGSEMKVVQSQFDKNDDSVEALTARNQVLGIRGMRFCRKSSRLIFFLKSRKSMRAKCRSIMWREATKQLCLHKSLTWCSLKSRDGRNCPQNTAP